MHSSSGEHYIALDHVRALAAFMVFAWHFTHYSVGYPVPFEYVPSVFPLALFDEGHTGVALFMTLSGYLFAKLLSGKKISFSSFIWNRALRLLPLLAVVLGLVAIERLMNGDSLAAYAISIVRGALYPTLPNGGWSITTEFHFYLVLPLLLLLLRRSPMLPVILIAAVMVMRVYILARKGQIQSLSYWTIVGRIDQFVLGILAFHFRSWVTRRHLAVAAIGTLFMTFWWWFDEIGGFYQMPSYPSPSRLWVVIPTIEGLAYGAVIAWYDTSFHHKPGLTSRCVARFGEYSYSIYLLHVFVVFGMARVVNEHIMDISNFYVALAWAVLAFGTMIVPGYLSFRFIESPFLKRRRKYILDAER